jgi:hypothetical protein
MRRKPQIKTDHSITVLRVLLLRSLVERYKCLRRNSRFHIQGVVGRRVKCWPRAKEFESVTEWKGADLKRTGNVKVKTLIFIPVRFILLLYRCREQVTRKHLCLSTKLHIMSYQKKLNLSHRRKNIESRTLIKPQTCTCSL